MKILAVGDSPTVDTGFGVVMQNLLKRLHSKGHEIIVLGINGYGDPYDQTKYPYMIYPCEPGSHEKAFGIQKLWYLEDKHKPDLIFFLNDPWVIDSYFKARPPGKRLAHQKIIGYYPIDAGPLKKKWADVLTNSLDIQVCYSHFAEGVITEANGFRPENLRQIYHGVDREVYKPVNQQFSRLQLGLNPTDFIVGMVARNQYRKRFDILIRAFADFAKDKPEAKLYLHTATKDIGFDIAELLKEFDINKKTILTEGVSPAKGVPEQFLNLIYNSLDVHCLISLGDGFGLPVAESMATACPQIVSNHSSLKELVEGHGGVTVDNAAWMMNVNGINTWGGVSDAKDLTKKLNLLYKNKDLRHKLGEDGYNYISQPKFDWDVIANQFNDIIDNLFHILPEKRNGITTLSRSPSLPGEISMGSTGDAPLVGANSLY